MTNSSPDIGEIVDGVEICCWPRCQARVVSAHVPVCNSHYEAIGVRYVDERTIWGSVFKGLDRDAKQEQLADRVAVEIKRNQYAAALKAEREVNSVVYYVKIGHLVKIGFTADLKQRLAGLRLDKSALLATEPGGRALEMERHAQFADDRVGRREDFVPSMALMEHIQGLSEETAYI